MCSCTPTFAPSNKLSYFMSKLSLSSNKKTEAAQSSEAASEPNYIPFIKSITRQALRQLDGCENNRDLVNKNQRVVCWINNEYNSVMANSSSDKVKQRIAKHCLDLAVFTANKEKTTCQDVYYAARIGAIQAVVNHYSRENKSKQLDDFLKTMRFHREGDFIEKKVLLIKQLSEIVSQLENPSIETIKEEAKKLTSDPDLVDEITFFYTQ